MAITQAIAPPVLSRLIDLVLSRFTTGLPLRGIAAFHAPSATFLLSLDNRTAAPVRLDRIVLRAFHERSTWFQSRGLSSWFQPVNLEILKSDDTEHEAWWGLKNDAVAPYSRAVFSVGHRLVLNRVKDAAKIQLIAIEGNTPVWKYSMSTKWLRDAIRDAIREGWLTLPGTESPHPSDK